MSKDKKNAPALNDLETSGRVHDGYAYIVYTKDAGKIRFHDADNLSAVQARWVAAINTSSPATTFVSFSGARRADTYPVGDGRQVTEIGKIEGAGVVLSSQVVSIRYAADWDDHAEEALEAARATFEVQAQAVADAAGANDDEEEVEEQDAVISDEDIGEEGFKS